MRSWMTRLGMVALAISASGCFAISDLSRFQIDQGCDVDLDLQGFTPHADDLFELRVVKVSETSTTPILSARAILDPMGALNARIVMKHAAAPGTTALDFYSDEDHSGGYTDPPADHVWRIDNACVPATHLFRHRFDFVNLMDPTPIGEDFVLHLTGMNTDGNALEVRVVSTPPESATDPLPPLTVGLYRKATMTEADLDVRIAGIIDAGEHYQVTIWSDKNGNGVYDAPPTDESWIIPEQLGAGLVDATFAHVEDYNEIDPNVVLVH